MHMHASFSSFHHIFKYYGEQDVWISSYTYVQGCMTVSMNFIAMHIHMATQFEHDHYSDYEGQCQ